MTICTIRTLSMNVHKHAHPAQIVPSSSVATNCVSRFREDKTRSDIYSLSWHYYIFFPVTCHWCACACVCVCWGVLPDESGVSATVQVAPKHRATSGNQNTDSWSHTGSKRVHCGRVGTDKCKVKGGADEADTERWRTGQERSVRSYGKPDAFLLIGGCECEETEK